MSMFRLSGDGMAGGTVTPELMAALKSRVELMESDFSGVTAGDYDAVRLCEWDGQNRDGLLHDDGINEAFPFEGAPDFRVRLADGIINEEALMYLLAAMRAQIYVIGPGSGVQRGKKLQALAEWMKSSLWGKKYARAVLELAQYVLGDSPAVGMMKVTWRNVKRIRVMEISTPEAVELFTAGFMEQFLLANPDAVREEAAIAANAAQTEFAGELSAAGDDMDEDLASRLVDALPYLSQRRAKRVVRDLRLYGKAKFPRPMTVFEGPDLEAARFFTDFVFEGYATSFDDLDCWFEPVWLTEAGARQLALEEGWSQAFQDALFGTETNHADGGNMKGKATLLVAGQTEAPEQHKEHFQVIRAWVQLTNDDGVVGRYWLTFRKDIPEAATPLRSMDYPHGQWPAVFFEREVLNKALLAGRGITELVSGEQGILKLLVDGFGANAVLNNTPAILSSGTKNSGQNYIEPLYEIQLRTGGKFEFMDGPKAPVQVPEMIKWLERNVDAQHGRPNADVPQTRTDMIRQARVIWFLIQLGDVWRQALALCQEYMTPELLEAVTGRDGAAIIKDKKEIEGPFTLSLHFNPEDLDIDKLKAKAAMIKDVLVPLSPGTISTSEVVAHVVNALFPQLELVKAGDQAQSDEIADEENQYIRILAGLEDKRPTDGSIAYGTRLQWLQGQLERNMAQVQALPAEAKLRLEDRLAFLGAQDEQFGTNAQIGREGAERIAGGGPGGPSGHGGPDGRALAG